eukprot:6665511-Prorocentrum_lima.AAC.1
MAVYSLYRWESKQMGLSPAAGPPGLPNSTTFAINCGAGSFMVTLIWFRMVLACLGLLVASVPS